MTKAATAATLLSANAVYFHQAELFPQAPQFVNGKPDVGQSQAGDRTANVVIHRQARKPRITGHEMVRGPDGYPRKQEKGNAQLKAEQDVEDEKGSLHSQV